MVQLLCLRINCGTWSKCYLVISTGSRTIHRLMLLFILVERCNLEKYFQINKQAIWVKGLLVYLLIMGRNLTYMPYIFTFIVEKKKYKCHYTSRTACYAWSVLFFYYLSCMPKQYPLRTFSVRFIHSLYSYLLYVFYSFLFFFLLILCGYIRVPLYLLV